MGSYSATWEDEDNNRQIHFSVDYTSKNGSVEIAGVTPTKVSFICPDSNTCIRAIRVHTEAGKKMLANHFHKMADVGRLADEIAARMQQPAIA